PHTQRPIAPSTVFACASREARLWNEPHAANDTNLRGAMEFIDGLSAGGGTEMGNAIDAAVKMEGDKERNPYVFFKTDGFIRNDGAILQKTEEYTAGFGKVRKNMEARVFGFGVGSSPNAYLLEGLSAAGDGATVFASNREDPTRAVNKFFALIDHPVITDIEIDWG